MSEVKRYDISAFGGMSMDECSDGAYINYDDYMALEAKCAALAAENAALRSKAAELVHEASKIYSTYNSTITEPDGDFMDMQTLHEMQCIETTATDAFLAEVRAQGVEMFGQYHNFSGKLFIQKEAQKFAAQLREGGN